MDIDIKEQIEIQFWKNSPHENSMSESIENLVNKACEARTLLEKLAYHKQYFDKSESILEIGAGQGWASCIVKKYFPDKKVIASDISKHAIASVNKWEYIFKASLDHKLNCRSYEIPLDNESIDLIFCFESAHHFVRHRKSLEDIYRVLKKGGTCLYLHEPSCRQYLYKLAHSRVNRIRPEVPEDVLIYTKIQQIANQIGFKTNINFDRTCLNRGPTETIYYLLLQKIPLLYYYLPCTADFIFKKK